MTVAELMENIERAIVRNSRPPPGVPAGVSYMAILISDPIGLIAEIREILTRAQDETSTDSAQTRAWNNRE